MAGTTALTRLMLVRVQPSQPKFMRFIMCVVVNLHLYREAKKDMEYIQKRLEKEKLKSWTDFLEWKPAEAAMQKILDNLKAGSQLAA